MQCFIQVIWKYYYSISGADHGTLYQLRNLIGRSNVSGDPTKKYNECDDFFKLIVKCHILVAALQHLNMKSLSDVPDIDSVSNPENLWMIQADERKTILQEICEGVVNKFSSFDFNHQHHRKTRSAIYHANIIHPPPFL